MVNRNLKRYQDAVDRIRENKSIDFETAVTIYMIKTSCSRSRAIEMVDKSFRIQHNINELLPKLEFVIRFYMKQLEGEKLTGEEQEIYDEIVNDFPTIFEGKLQERF